MANREQVAMLRRDVQEWNQWRQRNQSVVPDLRGADLRGCDLRGANLTGVDIRSAKFGRWWKAGKAADLTGADLTGATAGLQGWFVLVQWLISAVLGIVIGLLFWIAVGGIASIILWTDFPGVDATDLWILRGCSLLCALVPFLAIACQGLTSKAAVTVVTAFAIALVAGAVAGAVELAGAAAGAVELVRAVAFAVIVVFAGAVAGAVELAFAVAFAVAVIGVVAGAVVVAVAVAVAVAIAVAVELAGAGAVAGAVAGASLLLGWYVAHQANRGDAKFALARQLGLALAAIGGTNFTDAILIRANLKKSKLKNTTFHNAVLTRTNFRDAQQLHKASPGNSLLANFKILDLLITPDGHYGKNLSGLNLRGAYLADANLENVNLSNTDLADADLTNASFKNANLREANCIGTTFTGAYLTGACLESWNINNTTVLQNIDCQHIFLLEKENSHGSRERRPHDSNTHFQPGDFEKLFSETSNLVEILIRDGLNPEACSQTFQTLMAKFAVTPDNLKGIEIRGDDVLVIVEVPEVTDKGEFERTLRSSYDKQLAMVQAEWETTRLAASQAEQQGQRDRQEKQQLLNILSGFAQKPTQISPKTELHPPIHNQPRALSQNDGGQYAEQDIINHSDTGLSQDDILNLLACIENAIQTRTDLPDGLKQKSMRYLGAATEEAKEAKPDKQLMGSNLKKMGSIFSEAGKTVKAANTLSTAIAPAMVKLGKWLAIAWL